MLTTAIVGAGAPIANGLALAAQNRGEDRVTIVNFGDGATSIGAVHEAMNMAGVWKLPVIFLCQNNLIGEYTPIPEYTASADFASRAAGYGFKGVKSIVRVHFTDRRPISFWEQVQGSEYGFWANVNPAVPHPRWSQANERMLGSGEMRPTQIYNGYGEFVADLYKGLEKEKLWM
jgi:hypothetical protein